MQKTLKYDAVIWDFNGTILDDTKVSFNGVNNILFSRKMKTLENVQRMRELFCFPCIDYYKKLGFDFSVEPYEEISNEWVEYYNGHINDSILNDGVVETLSFIKNLCASQIIISACEKSMLIGQIERFSIGSYFDDIIGSDNTYAHGKDEIVKEKIESADYKRPILIGDTSHDYFCAKESGCDCVLFSGGFMSKERLVNFGVPVIDRISDLINYLF